MAAIDRFTGYEARNEAQEEQQQQSTEEARPIGEFPLIDGYPSSEIISIVDGIETVPAASQSVSIYADTFADLPRFVRRKDSRNDRPRNHWLTNVLNNPHRGVNASKFWRWVGRELAAHGDCYLGVVRDRSGLPMEFLPARQYGSNAVGGFVDQPGNQVWLQVPSGLFSGNTISQEFRSEDVLHFSDQHYDPFTGRSISPLQSAAKNPIGTYKKIWSRYLQRLGRGGHDNIFFNLPESEDEWGAFYKRFQAQAGGTANAGRPFAIPFGSDVKTVSATDVQRETVALLNFLVIEIARAWGIPPFMLFARLAEGVSARARSDLAEQFLNWQRLRYASFVKSVTSEIDMKILEPLAARGVVSARNMTAEFDLDHMTMGTYEGRANIAVQLHTGGILTTNEGRGLVGFDRIDGGDELPQVRGAPEQSPGRGTSAAGDEPNEAGDRVN